MQLDQFSYKRYMDNGYTRYATGSYIYKIILMPHEGYYSIKEKKISPPIKRGHIFPINQDLFDLRYAGNN